MWSFALLALMAATAYADGHETMSNPDEDTSISSIMRASYLEEFDGMNSAQIVIKFTNDVIDALIYEPINNEGLVALKNFRVDRLKEVLELFCEGGDDESNDDKDKSRRLDGHEMTTMNGAPTNSTISVIDEDGNGD